MKPSLRLKIKKAIDTVSRDRTLADISSLLEECGIEIKGDLTNTSKKKLLTDSLRVVDDENVIVNFLEKIITPPKREFEGAGSSIPIYLHPGFRASKVERFIGTCDYEEAVRVAFLRINNRVKSLSGLSTDGAPLMLLAFSPNDPKLRINELANQSDRNEQQGIMHLFEGSMLAFRNPQSHDDERKLSMEEAQGPLHLANYLMGLLDVMKGSK